MENVPNSQAQQAPALPQIHLVRAEQVHKIPSIPAEQKNHYIKGITHLWNTINSKPHTSAEYQDAHKKLVDVSKNITASMSKWNAGSGPRGPQQNGGRSVNPGQPVQAIGPGSQGQQAAAQTRSEQSSEKNLDSADNSKLELPPHLLSQPPEEQEEWKRKTREEYAQKFGAYEKIGAKLQDLMRLAGQRDKEGRPLSPEELKGFTNRKELWQRQLIGLKGYLDEVKNSQRQWRVQRETQDQVASSGMRNTGNESVQNVSPAQVNQSRTAPEQPRQLSISNATIEATKSQEIQNSLPSTNPSTNGQRGLPPVNQPQSSQGQVTSVGAVASHQNIQPPLSVNTTSQHQSPQTSQPQTATTLGPYPLSHKAAMDKAARSYSQPNVSQSTPQPSTHAHPQPGNRELKNNIQLPIPPQLNIPPPQPVSMGPARPTLSGGASTGAMGPMGQPGITKHPGFVLEGEGERVLSKKKLEELVRQVTGGADGEGSETLHPDVEEVTLNHSYAFCVRIELDFANTQELIADAT